MNNRRVMSISLVLVLVVAFAATTVIAAPATGSLAAPRCVQAPASYALGVDGGLTALSRGEIPEDAVASPSARPSGVDGGILSLLFVRSSGASSVAASVNYCTAAFAAQGS